MASINQWIKNTLFIGLIAFAYCFGKLQWHSLNPKEPLQAGRIAFEWRLPKDKTALTMGQQNLGKVWQWILTSNHQIQQQMKQLPGRFSAVFPMESAEKKAQR